LWCFGNAPLLYEIEQERVSSNIMSIINQISLPRTVARVKAVNNDGHRLYLEYPNGQIANVDSENVFTFNIGSVVLIRIDENQISIEPAPDELWPEETWIGVVRLKLEDITVVDSNGHWKALKTRNDIEYNERNTIEAKDNFGVIRVLSKEPLKYVDLPAIDDNTIAKFKTKKGEGKETFEDFGGFIDVVDRARELIELPLKRKEKIQKIGARPIKGVLFTGLPGTGKTMLARIIANSTDAVFYEISGPEIFSKWYGQSEEILRMLFEDAAKQEQAIIFFDEIDSVAGQRDDNAHEESRRVVAQLLTLMDGFTTDNNVIVIAATNRPQDIDAALRRPGRFDWEINFPMPDRLNRELILKASAKHILANENLPHEWVSQNTDGWSAAELSAIWSEAALLAAGDDRTEIIIEDYIGGFERVSALRLQIKKMMPKGG
jgi:transitional endoplasmic reticulum ATPase